MIVLRCFPSEEPVFVFEQKNSVGYATERLEG